MDGFHFHECRQKDDKGLALIVEACIVRLQEGYVPGLFRIVTMLQDGLHKGAEAVGNPRSVLRRKPPAGLNHDGQVIGKSDTPVTSFAGSVTPSGSSLE